MKRQTFNEINITPLTDIFLVLLIIMMVIAPMLDQQGLNLAIPDYVEKTQNTNDENKILTVTVSADNKYYVDGEEIAENDLFNTIKNNTDIEKYPRNSIYKNQVIYHFRNDLLAFEKSIIDYLAGMSDVFLIQVFNELISF